MDLFEEEIFKVKSTILTSAAFRCITSFILKEKNTRDWMIICRDS